MYHGCTPPPIIFILGKSLYGLLVKVLTCNQKVAGSSPTRVRLFLAYECTQLYLQKWEGVYHRILRRGCKAVGPGELVNISNLCYSSFLVKPYLVKTLVKKLKKKQKKTNSITDYINLFTQIQHCTCTCVVGHSYRMCTQSVAEI